MAGEIWQLYVVGTACYVAGALAVASLPVSVVMFLQWWRLTPPWPPAASAPIGSVGDGPYRDARVDTRLSRRVPAVVCLTTLAGLLVGEMILAASLVALTWSVVLVGQAEPAREDQLLGKGLAAVTLVAIVAAIQLLRIGSSLLLRGEAASARAARAASWSMGAGVTLFALLFGVLGGAVGQHQGWLCLTLLASSLVCITLALLLRNTVEALDG